MQPDPIALLLRAENPARNCQRAYAIGVGQDLFGTWCVSLAWGRIGRPGRGRLHSFNDRGAALAFARVQLRRRLQSEKRIGVAYRVVAAMGDL